MPKSVFVAGCIKQSPAFGAGLHIDTPLTLLPVTGSLRGEPHERCIGRCDLDHTQKVKGRR